MNVTTKPRRKTKGPNSFRTPPGFGIRRSRDLFRLSVGTSQTTSIRRYMEQQDSNRAFNQQSVMKQKDDAKWLPNSYNINRAPFDTKKFLDLHTANRRAQTHRGTAIPTRQNIPAIQAVPPVVSTATASLVSSTSKSKFSALASSLGSSGGGAGFVTKPTPW